MNDNIDMSKWRGYYVWSSRSLQIGFRHPGRGWIIYAPAYWHLVGQGWDGPAAAKKTLGPIFLADDIIVDADELRALAASEFARRALED